MTQKEIESISLDITLLMQTILDVSATSEETANKAITFAMQFLKNNPKIKEHVGELIGSYSADDPNMDFLWDIHIEWLKNWDKS